MKRSFLLFLILTAVLATPVRAETETIDLKALAKESRVRRDATLQACPQGERSEATLPAVVPLVVSDGLGEREKSLKVGC